MLKSQDEINRRQPLCANERPNQRRASGNCASDANFFRSEIQRLSNYDYAKSNRDANQNLEEQKEFLDDERSHQ